MNIFILTNRQPIRKLISKNLLNTNSFISYDIEKLKSKNNFNIHLLDFDHPELDTIIPFLKGKEYVIMHPSNQSLLPNEVNVPLQLSYQEIKPHNIEILKKRSLLSQEKRLHSENIYIAIIVLLGLIFIA